MSSTGPSPAALTPDRSPSKAKLLVQRSDSRQHLAVHFAAAAIREDCSDDDDDENLVLTNVNWHEPAGNTLGAPNAKVLSTLADSSLPAVSGEPPVLVTESPLTAIDGAGSQCSRSLPLVSRVSIRHYQESKPTSFKGTEGECGKLFTKVCSAASVAATSITATKPLSFVRSLATETPELKETALKPKNLINIVKSLSSDSGSLDQEVKAFAGNGHGGSSSRTNTVYGPDFGTAKLPTNQQTNSNTKIVSESLLNMQLWRQFAQPRLSGAVLAKGATGSNSGGKNSIASDSKTAPTSPLTSPSDGRSSFFRVTEVEARIEDTKRRLSEVIQDPRQLLNRIMGEDTTGRSRAIEVGLPATTTDLVSLNGSTGESASCRVTLGDGCDPKSGVDPNTLDIEADVCATLAGVNSPPFPQPRHTTVVSDNVSLSDLVSRNEDEFEHLFLEDFDNLPDDLSRTSPEPAVLSEDTSEKEDDQRTRREDENETEEDDDFEEHASASPVPIKAILLIVFAVYTYLVLPLPEYINGLCVGLVLGFILAVFSMWWTSGFAVQDSARQRVRLGPPFKAKALEIGEPKIYRGWMNDVSSYDPETHHMALSRSVFVRLEGTMLRLSRPQCNIPRRAVYGERRKENFVSQNHYELAGCQVFLVPSGLAKKRVWNQKYPICLILASQSPECRAKDQREIEKEELIKDLEEGEDEEDEEEEEDDEEDEIRQDSEVVEHRAKRDLPGDIILYLFGRTGREKEEWFRRFLRVSSMSNEKSTKGSAFSPGRNDSACRRPAHSHDGSQINAEESSVSPLGPPCDAMVRSQRDYVFFLSKFFPNVVHHNGTLVQHADSSPTHVSKDAGHSGTKDMQYAWLNALLSRIFWDFLNERDWIDWVSLKIQKKLGKIKLPYFMNELRLTELDMGTSLPHIIHANKLAMDNQGLWIDLEVSYKGSFQMTLETKMNLTRLGKESDSTKEEGFRLKCSSLADSDEESSSAGSSDEEEDRPLPPVDVATGPICDKPVALGTEGFGGGGRTSRKILRFMDKITKSRYFQRATENEYIKKKMEEVSNTPLLLTVAVQECRGELAINIPSPPTDRIWYGFRRPPHLELKARPKLGERQVTFTHVQEWIESKLEQEFQKILVMPNMDDLYLPIMHPAPETNYNLQTAKKPSEATAGAACRQVTRNIIE